MKPVEFENHLHETLEKYDVFTIGNVPPVVTIEVDGKSIALDLNADLYESLVGIMREETKWEEEMK